MPPTSDRFEALRRTIAERDEEEAYLVLADYLQQIGDPRGELIILEHLAKELGEEPTRARAYFHEHRAELLGPLAQAEPYLSGVRWKLGFVRQASLHFPSDEPVQIARRMVQSALDSPAMALLHQLSLVVGSSEEPADQPNDLERAVVSALCARERPTIRWLSLFVLGAGRVSLKLISDALPRLETLGIESQRISFSGMKSSGVRAMNLFTGTVPVASFKSVEWRALETLSLIASIDGSLVELLDAVPCLTSFALSTAPRNLEIIGSLIESGAARRLKRLRINPIGRKEIDLLAAEAQRFESIERIEINRAQTELADRFPPHVVITDAEGRAAAAEEADGGIDYVDDP